MIAQGHFIQFSGGRTSGYLLKKLLEQHGGKLPTHWHVCFENTGKEREETLEFVAECERRWKTLVYWLEYADDFDPQDYIRNGKPIKRKLRKTRYKIVNFEFEQIKAWGQNPEDPKARKYLNSAADQTFDCFCGSD